MTAHRHDLGRWATPAKIVALPVGIVLIAIWGVGLGIVVICQAPIRLLRWLRAQWRLVMDTRPGWDDA